MPAIIECVPNFSEGRDKNKLQQIAAVIQATEGVKLLHVDPGKSTNRTVFTFVGAPDDVIKAAHAAIIKAAELIDMRQHSGEHPRMGATDVCPLIPISGISLEETAEYAQQLGRMVGSSGIPVYMYEAAAKTPQRTNLAVIRRGEYEGLEKKMKDPDWKPDYGPDAFNPTAGATVIGARDFLVAYNVNLNTRSVRRANSVAFDVRERGRIKRIGHEITGEIARDDDGNPIRQAGELKAVKAIGWYIDEYDQAQISMNLTDLKQTSVHEAFEACRRSASRRGMRVTGSELIGLAPKSVFLQAGRYFLQQQRRSTGVSEEVIIDTAVKSLGLDDLQDFDPKKRIIEYLIDADSDRLIHMSLEALVQETASDSMAPGGGSISAAIGACGASLACMVANLSANKRDWDDRVEEFSAVADRAQEHIRTFLDLVDDDTAAFDGIMSAIRLPKGTDVEKSRRLQAINQATLRAIEVPMSTLRTALSAMDVVDQMISDGNPSSVSDAGVAALSMQAAGEGAYMNVLINLQDYDDEKSSRELKSEADELLAQLKKRTTAATTACYAVIKGS